MQITKTIEVMRRVSQRARLSGTLGLVPTMGALHDGHLSLVRRARSENKSIAASIFVNPLQFGRDEDLARYPRTFEEDCALLEKEGVDYVFAPSPEEMYPGSRGMEPVTAVHPGPIADRLDGASRPGHFIGVATVVVKLLNIVQPDCAYFGQKDAAQLAVLRQVVRELDMATKLVACPVIRDPDGLALSSRNRYLSPGDRADALILSRTLAALEARIHGGVRNSARLCLRPKTLRNTGSNFHLEYLAVVDSDTLLPVPIAVPGTLIAIAAKVGSTRLIDNFLA